jgi:hypothetical protein
MQPKGIWALFAKQMEAKALAFESPLFRMGLADGKHESLQDSVNRFDPDRVQVFAWWNWQTPP